MLTQEQINRVYLLLLSTIVVKYLLQYEQDGFLVVKQLLTLDECQKLKVAADELIDNWEPDEVYSWIFLNDTDKAKARAQRMLAMSDKLSFTIEGEAIDPHTGIM